MQDTVATLPMETTRIAVRSIGKYILDALRRGSQVCRENMAVMELGSPEMYQHRFEQASRFPIPDLDNIVGAIFKKIGGAFRLNMKRVQGLGTLPIQLVASATLNEAARVEAMVNKGFELHDPKLSNPNHPEFDEKRFTEVDEERRRLVKEWMNRGDSAARFTYLGVEGMNAIIRWNEDEAWFGVQGAMSAMLIGLWTAFESLAQDTWITAVNACPVPLAKNVMDAPESALKTGNQSKSISYAHFAGSDFDFRSTMGNLLFAERKVDFQQLKTLRAAYKVAFAGQLESAFQAQEQSLSELETIRNVFVHKGGMIDRKFLGRMKSSQFFKDAKEGQLVFVSGDYVASQAIAVCNCSTKIVIAVDGWLKERSVEGTGT
jgi:hypothetical protein